MTAAGAFEAGQVAGALYWNAFFGVLLARHDEVAAADAVLVLQLLLLFQVPVTWELNRMTDKLT